MKIKRLMILAGILAPFSVSAQIPETSKTAKQLEALLQCKAGTTFTKQAVEAQFRALGLAESDDGFFLPLKGQQPSLFDDQVLAAMVNDSEGEKKVSVYLQKQTGKQMAKKLGATTIDEYANTDEPSYVKETSQKTTLLIGSAAELFGNTNIINYQSAVVCQLIK